MRVVVTGGRQYPDSARVAEVLDAIHRETPVVLLAHGGAGGADTLADQWAFARDIPAVRYRAQWELGRSAGPRRNRLMLDDFKPDVVVAFPGGPGTADCVRAARERGIRVIEVSPSPG